MHTQLQGIHMHTDSHTNAHVHAYVHTHVHLPGGGFLLLIKH